MFVFVDIETTGLDPQTCSLLEVGIALTDDNLELIESSSEVIYPGWDALDGLDDFIVNMHTKSGLLDEVNGRGTRVADAEDFLLGFLGAHDLEPLVHPMCGSSVHFDRAFLKVHMPRLESGFHYRNLDVSTLKTLVEQWAPELASMQAPPAKRHRAASDIIDTIDELRHYREHFLKI